MKKRNAVVLPRLTSAQWQVTWGPTGFNFER